MRFQEPWAGSTHDQGGEPDGSVDGDDPWYHFVYDERWRIVAVYRADTTTGDLDDDPKGQFIYPATNLVDIAGVVQACERRRFAGIRGGTGLDGYGSGSYIDAVILRDRDANATGGWVGERRHCGPPRGRAADAYGGRDAQVATDVAPPRRICDFTPFRRPARFRSGHGTRPVPMRNTD